MLYFPVSRCGVKDCMLVTLCPRIVTCPHGPSFCGKLSMRCVDGLGLVKSRPALMLYGLIHGNILLSKPLWPRFCSFGHCLPKNDSFWQNSSLVPNLAPLQLARSLCALTPAGTESLPLIPYEQFPLSPESAQL